MSNKRSGRLIAVVLAVCMVLGSGPAVLLAQASTDIQGHWAEQVISRWVDRKIVDGYPDGTFRPNAPIKRAEFAALINRTLGFITLSSIEFSDMSVDEWFATDVSKAVGAGYMDGYPDGTFRPNANISRQEAAMVLARILGLEATDETFGFTDIETIPAWSLWAVVAVANAGIMTGYPDGSFGPIDSFTRAETVTVLDRLVAEVFTEEGTYGDADEQTVIEGNVIITVGGVTLVNMHITGNLLIAESVGDGVVTLKDVTVDGTVTVSGGEVIEDETTALAPPGGGGPVIPEPPPAIGIRNVKVVNGHTITFDSNVGGATIKWNGVALSAKTVEGANKITVPLMVSDVANTLAIEKSEYSDFTKKDVAWTAPYDTIATLGEWTRDRTEPESWIEEDGWILLETKTEPANNWYAWQGQSSPTGVGLTSDWIVETQVELTEEMVSRDGIRVSIWLAVQGSNNFGGNHWAGVIDWSILQFKKDSTEDMAGWQAWNSAGSGCWEDLEEVPTDSGIYTLTMIYENGIVYQYIDGMLVNSYDINTDDGISAPTHIIIQSYSFGESYTAKWKVPAVEYLYKYPSAAKFIHDVDELTAAVNNQVNNQSEGETWIIRNGIYNHGRFNDIEAGGQAGWYFPIIANGLAIIGESKDGVVLTSDVFSPNGAWSSQDHISVWGDNVTIENLTIKPKLQTNKAIEVMGKDFTLRNVDFIQRDDAPYEFAGSLYFNPQNQYKDIGQALVEDVLINDGWISCGSAVEKGTLAIRDTTIDFRGSAYASLRYGVMSKNDDVIKVAEGSFFKVYVDNTVADLQSQVIDRMPHGATVELAPGTYYVETEIEVPTGVAVDDSQARFVVASKIVTTDEELRTALAAAADDGSSTIVAIGSFTATNTYPIIMNKKATLIGHGATISVSTGNQPIQINADGSILEGFTINKTDKSHQDIIYINANGVTIRDNTISGQYELGDSHVDRAMLGVSGRSGMLIEGNIISNLRQPAYFNGKNEGVVQNNYVTNTRGWVVCGDSNMVFENNTFGTNAVDIAIIDNTNGINNYGNTPEDAIAISADNNGAFVENQLSNISAKDGKLYRVVYIIEETGPKYCKSIQAAIDEAKSGATIVVNGTFGSEDAYAIYTIETSGITIQGLEGSKVYGTFVIKADDVTIDGLEIQNKGDKAGEASIKRGAIYVYADSAAITNNVIVSGLGNVEGLSNGIQVMRKSEERNTNAADYVITGNHLIGYNQTVTDWSSAGIIVTENNVTGVGGNYYSILVDDYEIATKNTFTDNAIDYVHQDWEDYASKNTVVYALVSTSDQLLRHMSKVRENATVLVAAGTYQLAETLHIGNAVTVEGVDRDTVVLEGANTIGDTVILSSGSTLRNVTVTRDNTGGWAENKNCQLVRFGQNLSQITTLENCIVKQGRNGVYLNNTANAIIKANLIENNRTGIQMANFVSATVEDNTITNNHAIGVLLQCLSADNYGVSTFANNIIQDNWYSDFENRWMTEYVVDLSQNTLTDSTAKIADNSGEPGYADLCPVELGGDAVRPTQRATFVMAKEGNLILPGEGQE